MSTASAPSDDRAERIVRHYALLRPLALRVQAMVAGAELDELIGDGAVGLIRAVDTFEASRGASLERYVRQVVVGAMLNGVRKRDPVSERSRRALREAERERFALAQERGSLPSTLEMEERRRDLRRANAAVARYTPLSLDAPLPPRTRMLDRGDDPADAVVARSVARELEGALETLPPRERRVLELHYRGEMPLRCIGTALRVSPQRASQLHLAALGRLRLKIAAS